MINRDDVMRYLLEWLREHTDQQVGDGDAPTPFPTGPYAVLHLIGTQNDGPFSHPDDDLELVVQVTCVGRKPGEARWMSDAVAEVMIGREPEGDYRFEMYTEGFTVQSRWASGLGAIVKSGDRLYESPDTYRLKVVPA